MYFLRIFFLIVAADCIHLSKECEEFIFKMGKQVIKRNFRQIAKESFPFINYSGKNINQFGDFEACIKEL
jgi:hypothetical protein